MMAGGFDVILVIVLLIVVPNIANDHLDFLLKIRILINMRVGI
jgi:hypothetical protein